MIGSIPTGIRCSCIEQQYGCRGAGRVDGIGRMSWSSTGVQSEVLARAEGITKVYGSGDTAVRALDDVTVGFPAGRYTAIMGPSGSGKSTLMHCLAGLDQVTSGKVWIGDTELSQLNDRQLTLLRRERVGFIFQAYNLLPTL